MNQFAPDNNLVGTPECNLYQLVYINLKSTASKYQSSEIINEGSPYLSMIHILVLIIIIQIQSKLNIWVEYLFFNIST